MVSTKNKEASATLAEQMAEFERLNGKVKTEAIQYRGKNLKPESVAAKDFSESVKAKQARRKQHSAIMSSKR